MRGGKRSGKSCKTRDGERSGTDGKKEYGGREIPSRLDEAPSSGSIKRTGPSRHNDAAKPRRTTEGGGNKRPRKTVFRQNEDMKRYIVLILALLTAAAVRASVPAPAPLYIVNGEVRQEIASIPPDDIESVEMLPADEENIARYGERAAHGVMLISLRYDQPAAFEAGPSFGSYIARQVKWNENEPAARVVLRYRITPDGDTVVRDTLESTDSRLKRRVLKAVAAAPRWRPALKNDRPVESEGVLSIQLPEGKPLPRPVELVIR